MIRSALFVLMVLVLVLCGGGALFAPAPAPAPAWAEDPPPAPGPMTVPGAGTERLMEQLRRYGLEPEQKGMDAQGLYDTEPRSGLLDRHFQDRRAEAEAQQDAGPLEPVLGLPPWLIPDVRAELRLIVRELARYARGRDPDFVILVRGGVPLAFRSRREAVLEAARAAHAGLGATDPDSPAAGVGAPEAGFLGAIDGVVMDGQFCGRPPVEEARLEALADLNLVRVSIDHCADAEVAAEARRRAAEADVLVHVDTDPDGALDTVPRGRPTGENAENISDPHQARSVLVLEDASRFGDVSRLVDALRHTNHDMLILDPFVLGDRALGPTQVRALKHKALGARRLVLATFDVAMAHADAYYWEPDWRLGTPRWLSATAAERPGAFFTEFWDPAWKALLGTFFVSVMDLGFDGVVLEGLDVVHRWEAITPAEY